MTRRLYYYSRAHLFSYVNGIYNRSIIGNEVFMENIFTLMVLYVREILSLRPIYPRVTKIEPALKAIVTTRPFSLPCK